MSTDTLLPLGQNAHLGKQAKKDDERTLQAMNYIAEGRRVSVPTTYNWAGDILDWPMFGNDRIGDCTIAAAAHQIMWWTGDVGEPFIPSDQDVLSAYSAVSGYDPSSGANDNGAVELDVLNYWRKTGIAGRKIGAFAEVDPKNTKQVRAASYLFEGLYLGLALPKSVEGASSWRVPYYGPWGSGEPGSWGGHAVPVVEYDRNGLTVITWGQPLRMTWNFLRVYCDEAYAIVSNDMLDAGGVTPLGINVDQLTKDLQQVAA